MKNKPRRNKTQKRRQEQGVIKLTTEDNSLE